MQFFVALVAAIGRFVVGLLVWAFLVGFLAVVGTPGVILLVVAVLAALPLFGLFGDILRPVSKF